MSLETWKEEFYPVDAENVPKEGAVAHSLQKWKGLRTENLVKHAVKHECAEVGWYLKDKSHVLFAVDSRTCALCALYKEGAPVALAL